MVIREETSEAGMDSLLLFKVSLYLRSKDGQSIVVSLLTDKSQTGFETGILIIKWEINSCINIRSDYLG